MRVEVAPKETSRASAFELWIMVIGTSAIVDTEIDGAVGMNSGIFNNQGSTGSIRVNRCGFWITGS